ncbi:hypothetical protein PSACC_02651 [Paramicrosporidium saccamoebae]|uniref:Smr domain-containing protein n=1 Tax=Paramicrosporidium saccamoebae TaxID=1246581 RepID=A0A2H9TII8_9FUNG|nr:hypothetical protein PSACC_02651 [Paramicrosporidium saccamoebae]
MDEETFDHQISRLLECFPEVDLEILTEAVLESAGSLPDAINHVLARILDQTDSEEDTVGNYSPIVLELRNIFPSIEVEVIDAFVSASLPETNVEVLSNELMLLLGEGAPTKKRKIQWKKLEHDEISQYCAWKLPSRCIPVQSPCKNTTELIRVIQDFLKSQVTDLDNLDEDPQDLRDQALELHFERGRIIARASEAHGRGGLTGGSSAQYYASEALKAGKKIEALHKKAGYLTFIKFNDEAADDEIDLHELTVSEALSVLDIIVQNFSSPGILGSERLTVGWRPKNLRLVTGAGRHSAAGPRLRPVIWQRLRELETMFRYDGIAVFVLYK